MTFKILTMIVFMAELIIAYTLIKQLWIWDKELISLNETICAAKSGIKDISYLIKKISAQYVEFAYDFVEKIKKKRDDSIINNLNKIIITLILLRMNSKFLKRIIRSKQFKLLSKGLSLLRYMV